MNSIQRFNQLRHAMVHIAAAVSMAGCLNQSNTLTHTHADATPDLSRRDATASNTAADGSPASLKGLDRRHWQTIVLDAPRGQVQVRETYGELLLLNGSAPRDGQTFPTTDDSLALSSGVDAASAEGAAVVVWPALMMVVSPIRMATGQPPWRVVCQPTQSEGVLPIQQTRQDERLWRWVSFKQEKQP